MGSLARLAARLRRRPVGPAVPPAHPDAARRALHDDVKREVRRSLGGRERS